MLVQSRVYRDIGVEGEGGRDRVKERDEEGWRRPSLDAGKSLVDTVERGIDTRVPCGVGECGAAAGEGTLLAEQRG